MEVLSYERVEVGTGDNGVSVMFGVGAAGVVEATPGLPERVVSFVVVLFGVAVLQSVTGTDVEVGATWKVDDVGNSEVVVG